MHISLCSAAEPLLQQTSWQPSAPWSWLIIFVSGWRPRRSKDHDICGAFLLRSLPFQSPLPCSPGETIQMELPSHPQSKLGRFVMRTHGYYPTTAGCRIQAAQRPQRECEGFKEGGKSFPAVPYCASPGDNIPPARPQCKRAGGRWKEGRRTGRGQAAATRVQRWGRGLRDPPAVLPGAQPALSAEATRTVCWSKGTEVRFQSLSPQWGRGGAIQPSHPAFQIPLGDTWRWSAAMGAWSRPRQEQVSPPSPPASVFCIRSHASENRALPF